MYKYNTPKQNVFKLGQEYMRLFPCDKRFISLFPEVRIIQLTQLASRYMPPLAALVFIWQIVMGASLGPAITTVIFACSLPFQGVLWLGFRAKSQLPLYLLHFLDKMKNALNIQAHSSPSTPLTYLSFARVLHQAYHTLDKDFFDQDNNNP